VQRATEMAIAVRYGYAASIGSLEWSLTTGQVTGMEHLTGAGCRWLGTIDRGIVNDLPSAWRHGRASDYRPSNRAELLLMSL